MPPDCLAGRNTVWRQLHNERQVVVLDEFAHDHSRKNRQDDTGQVYAEQCQCRIVREKCSGYQHEYRQPSRARHKREDGDGDEPAFTAFNGACGHYCRNVATEAHYHRDERLAVKPYLVHQFVHDERRPGHISGILHQRDEEIQNQDVRQENKHAAHA